MLVEIRRLYLCSGENKFGYDDDDDDERDVTYMIVMMYYENMMMMLMMMFCDQDEEENIDDEIRITLESEVQIEKISNYTKYIYIHW